LVNAEAIIQKYWRAVDDLTNYQQDVLSDDAIRLALSLAVQDAFAAGAALADDLAAIVASQAAAVGHVSNVTDQRAAESAINQIGRLNEWLGTNAPALYLNPDLDTAAAMLAAIATLKSALEDNREDAASARQELTTLIAERDQLRQQMVQMDADEAELRRQLAQKADANTTLIMEIDRLTRQNVIATDTFNSLAERTNGNGANPTTAPGWNRSHPAWSGLPKADLDVIDQLASGATTFRKLSKALRRDLVLRVLRSLAVDGEVKSLTYDKRKPDWMPTSGAVVMLSETGRWSNLVAMTETTPA
jgi:hypothetical protein